MNYRKLRIVWSVLGLAALIFLLPDADSPQPSPWFLPALVGFCVFIVIPWFPLRFSLRTLLIATTLVAVVLGLLTWCGQPGRMTEAIRCNFCGLTYHEAGPMLEQTDRQVRHRWVRICRDCAAQAVEVLGSQSEDGGERDA